MHAEHHYDAIIIGSGMGGLTTASLLSQLGRKRVLILERHFKAGGFTHSFRRKKYEWDVGVHYVGQMQPGASTRAIMDLVTRKQVAWNPMGTIYDRIVFPNDSFDMPKGQKEFQSRLITQFPEDETPIRRYFRDLKRIQGWIARWFIGKQYGHLANRILTWPGRALAEQTTEDYMQRFSNPILRAILTGQWPDFGTPPNRSAFGFHATVAADFLDGGYYPVGGSKVIAQKVIEAVQAQGGNCFVNHSVKEIVIENNRATGVVAVAKDREVRFTAPLIISNAGAVTTFRKLLPESYGTAEREQAQAIKPGPSAAVLFLGLKDDPRRHGFDDVNYWIYRRTDHNDEIRVCEGQPHRIDGVFVSFGSLRNPGQEPHTAQIVSFSRHQDWKSFGNSTWMNRGADYDQFKSAVSGELLACAEEKMPGLSQLVDYQELSTPLTFEHFTGHHSGVIYGQECDRARLSDMGWRIGTSVKNLYLTGSDVGTPGVNGAMMAGVMTTAKLLGPTGLPRIFTRAFR